MYAASEACADMRYATGFMAPDPFVWLELHGKRLMILSALEVGRAGKMRRPDTAVLSHADALACWQLPADTPPGPGELLPAIARSAEVSCWEVPYSFPFGLAADLQKTGLTVTPVTPFFPERQCKTAAEVQAITHGVRLAESGLARALDVLGQARPAADGVLMRDGAPVTAEAVAGEIAAAIARLGGTAAHTIVAPGVQAADPHETGHGPIRVNEPIVIDIFPRADASGYHGDLTRTVVKGRAPEPVRRAHAAVDEARRAAVALAAPGVRAADVHEAADRVLRQHGFETDAAAHPPYGFFHGVGHGLGLDVHEAPRVSRTSDHVLETGNVVTIEPGLYYPRWGGVRIEDVITITQDGCRNLTAADVALEIA